MYSVMKGILAFLSLSHLLVLANGIMCHQCQYAKCRDNYDYDPNNLGDCGDGYYCVKYKTIAWIHDSGEITGSLRESHVVTRDCEAKKGQKVGCTGWQNNGGVTLKCWCGSDGCNGGRSLQAMKVPVILSALLGVFMTFLSLCH